MNQSQKRSLFKDQEQYARVAAPLTAVVMIAQQAASAAVRDTLFLAYFPVGDLPYFIALSACLSFPLAHVCGTLLTSEGPRSLSPGLLLFSGLLFLLEFRIIGAEPRLAVVLLYVHSTVIGSLAISAYWSLLNERFDPNTAKPLLSRVASGATLGGLLGGLGVARSGGVFTVESMLLLLCGLTVLSTAGTLVVRMGPGKPRQTQTAETSGVLAEIWRVPLLTRLAFISALTACLATLADYLLKADVANHFRSREDMIRFFGIFYAATGVTAFVMQTATGRALIERFGLAAAIASHPIAIGAASIAGFFLPVPWRGVLPRGADIVFRNSFFRAAYEILFTPLADTSKRQAKAIIDVGIDSAGRGIGAGIIFLLAWTMPGPSLLNILTAITTLAIVQLLLARLIHSGYVGALEDGLYRGGEASADSTPDLVFSDFYTARSLAGVSRSTILKTMEIAASRAEDMLQEVGEDPLAAAIMDLRSESPSRIRKALRQNRNRPELVGFIIPLLSRTEVLRDIIAYLRDHDKIIAGQLCDSLLSSSTPEVVRRRLPFVLKHCATQISVLGLVSALSDPSHQVRHRSSRALVALTKSFPELNVPGDLLLKHAVAELQNSGDGSGKQLDHVFHLLSLALNRPPLRVARKALQSSDTHLRGTALEYMESVLPASILHLLQPAFKIPAVEQRPAPRDASQVEADLYSSYRSQSFRKRSKPS